MDHFVIGHSRRREVLPTSRRGLKKKCSDCDPGISDLRRPGIAHFAGHRFEARDALFHRWMRAE